MTRSKLADLSEILSSIAVLITLVYLTVEVRQNTDAMRAQTRQSVLEASQTELNSLIDNPRIALALTGGQRPLTPDEHVMVDAWLTSALRTREFAWLQYREGTIDVAQWETERLVMVSIFDSAITRLWWNRQGRDVTSQAFAVYVDSLLEATPQTDRVWNATWSLPDSTR